MPGFTLIYQHKGLDEGVKDRTERLVKASFKIQFISKTDELMILFRDGNHYPYEIIENDDYILIIEGKIYGIDPLSDNEFQKKIRKIFVESASGSTQNVEQELSYIRNLDGEFIIYLIGRKGENILVLNDFFGRLPQYYRKGRQFILSRDIYVMDKVTTGLLFDDSTVYQFLRLGFSLGSRTMFHDINRLPYSALVHISGDEIDVSNSLIDIDEMEGSVDVDNPEEELFALFRKAMEDRLSNEGPFVLSLSGGLDSRLIMGEIEKRRFPTEYVTFAYDNAIIQNDVTVAKELGKNYNRSPQLIELKEYSPEAFDELTLAKGGMNYVGMAFLIRYLIQLGHDYNIMFTGDGGDKTLPYLFPSTRVKPRKFAKFILQKHQVSTKKSLSSFLLSDVVDEENRLIEYLENIEGKSTNLKYKHFLLFERARNWLAEGEDRNRSYLWSTSPFYQPAFFKLAHSLAERTKKNFKLFRNFTNLVDPSLNQINNANWQIPLADSKKVDQMLFRQKVKSRLPNSIFKQLGHLSEHKEMASLVASLMHRGFAGQLSIYADQHDLNAASSETLFHLITLLKVSEMTWREV